MLHTRHIPPPSGRKRTLLLLIWFLFSASLAAQNPLSWRKAAWHSAAIDYDQTAQMAVDGDHSTAWVSPSGDQHWIYVDLGAVFHIHSIRILWHENYAVDYILQTDSNQAGRPVNWHTEQHITAGKGGQETYQLEARARYVSLLINTTAESRGVKLAELEVFGENKAEMISQQNEQPVRGNHYSLTGNGWQIERCAAVADEGTMVSKPSYTTNGWMPAKVPTTSFAAFVAGGAVPDPVYADDQLQASEAYFNADFWYRKTFKLPKSFKGKQIWVHFQGINWKAAVFFNGHYLGDIQGAFVRKQFDITPFLFEERDNCLAVLIRINDHPGLATEQHLGDPDPNGGIIGRDSPTYVSAIGWNWMPTIRGRNTGITDEVFLTAVDRIQLSDPQLQTTIVGQDTTMAEISLGIDLANSGTEPVSGKLKARSSCFSIETFLTLEAKEQRRVVLNKREFSGLMINQPKLWWPNGYGAQQLDSLHFEFEVDGRISDSLSIVYGIRQLSYQVQNGNLRLLVNGFPIIVRGGNWGLPELLLRCDSDCYDLLVRYHRDMNLNMIRNWVGQTASEAFYEACDRYGLLIWDDFWLANPVDGPDPDDESLFLVSATDKVKRFRNHPSVALWVGRNEGFPTPTLDAALRKMVNALDPDRHYISNSADYPVSGLGPYENMPPEWYFQYRGYSFHTEQGLVAVPSVESLKAMMPDSLLWPVNDMWGKHDWTQTRVKIFTQDVNTTLGEADDLNDFVRKAQWMSMERSKAMMEAWQMNRGPGVLVWMTHPAWPSLICQTYDYFREPTAAYIGIKKGSEPLHIFLNPLTMAVHVSNNRLTAVQNHRASMAFYDLMGKLLWQEESALSLASNCQVEVLALPEALTGIRAGFLKLKLLDEKGFEVSANFYPLTAKPADQQLFTTVPEVIPVVSAKAAHTGDGLFISVELHNNSPHMALMLRLMPVQGDAEERMLPAFWSDQYFSLTPGESKIVTIKAEKTIGNQIAFIVSGWNAPVQKIQIEASAL